MAKLHPFWWFKPTPWHPKTLTLLHSEPWTIGPPAMTNLLHEEEWTVKSQPSFTLLHTEAWSS